MDVTIRQAHGLHPSWNARRTGARPHPQTLIARSVSHVRNTYPLFGGAGRDRPMEKVEGIAGARRVATALARLDPPPEDAGHSEDDIVDDIIADIAAAREERRRNA